MVIRHCPIQYIRYCHSPSHWNASSLGWDVLCGNSAFESLQAAPFPELKHDHHHCRIIFLVQWSGNCEIQKKNLSHSISCFFFFSSPFTSCVPQLQGAHGYCAFSAPRRWDCGSGDWFYLSCTIGISSHYAARPLVSHYNVSFFFFIYSASLTEALLCTSLWNRSTVRFRGTTASTVLKS